MATIDTRLLDDVKAELEAQLVPASVKKVELIWRDWTAINADEFPWLGIELDSGEDVEHHPGQQILERTFLFVWGYIRTAESSLAGRQKEREDLRAKVVNVCHSAAMRNRLVATFQANGGKGTEILYAAGVERDAGQLGPYGIFKQRFMAPMHSTRGAM